MSARLRMALAVTLALATFAGVAAAAPTYDHMPQTRGRGGGGSSISIDPLNVTTVNGTSVNAGILDAGTARINTLLAGSVDAGNVLVTGGVAITGSAGLTLGNASNTPSISIVSPGGQSGEIMTIGQASTFVGSMMFKGRAANGGAETALVIANGASLTSSQSLTQWRNGAGTFSGTKVREVMSNGLVWSANADAGVPGNITINQPSGTVAIATTAAGMTLTNSLVTAATRVRVQLMTNDATCAGVNAFPSASSVAINCNAGTVCATAAGCNVFFEVLDQRP